MNPVMRKRNLFGCERNNLSIIKQKIEHHLWCPPVRQRHGNVSCSLCEMIIDLDKCAFSFYAVWCGFICERCNSLYKGEIEELSKL